MMNDECRMMNEIGFDILHSEFVISFRGMVSMVSMEVSKTLGPGSSPGTPAINIFMTN